jgi:hypothetical protein
MGRAHEGRSAACARPTAAREADRPPSGHKTWQAENPDDRLGRTRPTSACHCSSLPACPRTAALRSALCPSLRVSSFSFVLACLPPITIFSLHAIQALCFSKNFFESHFLLSFSLHTIQAPCFSKKFFESHFLLSFSPWNRLKS